MSTASVMSPEAAGLIKKYYAYSAMYTLAASIIWGINTLFLLNAGLSISEVFLANAAFSAGIVLFEIPTGVVADTIGRRTSFLFSLVVLASSTLVYVYLAEISAGIVAFCLASVFIGLGFTFYSGAMEAWLVDGVREYGFSGDLDKVFANAQIVSGVSMIVGTVSGGFLGQVNLSIPFVVRASLLGILFVFAYFGMHDIGFQPRKVTLRTLPAEAKSVAVRGTRHAWGSRPLRAIMIAGAIQMGFFIWAWYAWQPYFLELLEKDAVWIAGIVAALMSLAMIAGNGLVRFFTRFCGRRTTLLLWTSVVFALGSIGVGLATSFPLALLSLLIGAVALGVQMPIRQTFIHGIAPSSERATVVSFDSMITGIGGVGGQVALGGFSERHGYAAAYIVGGTFVLLALPFILLARRLKPDADRFEGTKTPDVPSHDAPAEPRIGDEELS